MKGRTKLGMGGVAAGAVILAVILSRLPWLGGLGSGDGKGPGEGDRTRVSVESKPSGDPPAESERPPAEVPPLPVALDVVEVVVEEDGYSLKETRDGAREYRRVSLDELVALAQRTPARDGRVRVRITMRPDAPGVGLRLLVEKLIDSGIDRAAIEGSKEIELEAGP